MNFPEILGNLFRGEQMISVLAVGEVVIGEICSIKGISQEQLIPVHQSYPEMIISSSTP